MVTKKPKEFNPSFIEYPEQIRGISKETLEKFTYGVHNGKHCTYYYDANGDIVAEKYRSRNKEFSWSGDSKNSTMFGQNVWKASDRIKLIITEGEIDALSVSEIQGNKYPVVSLPNGAASAKRDIKKNYEYLTSFKEVVLMFDNDEAGKKAAIEVQEMFPPKYCKIAELPLKDANEMLKAGRGRDLVSAIFNAKIHVPEEIRSGNKLLDLLDEVDRSEHYDFPDYVKGLTRKMRGMRIGDLTIITAGSGSGKTTFMKQLELHFYETTNFNQGIIHLEEGIRDTMEGLVSVKLGRQLHLEENSNTDSKVRKAWKELATSTDDEGNHRLNIVDTFGSLDTERLYSMIRYLAKVENCKVIYLDHISMLVSGMAGNVDERRALDNIMTSLKSLTQELDVHLFVVSHLNNNTNGGKPFEEGGVPTVNNLRGSGGLKQLADNVISLSRNQMAEEERERNIVTVSLLKCRKTGDTSITDRIKYDPKTGLFVQEFESVNTESMDMGF
jgi:twinkle protein